MIHGIGIDMVEVDRFRAAVNRRGEALLERLFTAGELDRCGKKRDPAVHLAARFAAKVSLMKALGRPLRFTSVEVARAGTGRPYFAFSGAGPGRDLRISLTISHDGGFGVAGTIVERVGGVKAGE